MPQIKPIIKIETDTGVKATLDTSKHPYALDIESFDTPTENFSFISPSMEELVDHFLESENTDFVVSIKGVDSISKSLTEPSRFAVRFKQTQNLMALGELRPNFIPEIGSILLASPEQATASVTPGVPESVWGVEGFVNLGKVVLIDMR